MRQWSLHVSMCQASRVWSTLDFCCRGRCFFIVEYFEFWTRNSYFSPYIFHSSIYPWYLTSCALSSPLPYFAWQWVGTPFLLVKFPAWQWVATLFLEFPAAASWLSSIMLRSPIPSPAQESLQVVLFFVPKQSFPLPSHRAWQHPHSSLSQSS